MRNPIIVALDLPDADAAFSLATQLAPVVGVFKVGKELFTAEGPDVVRRIRATGSSVFLDLKFHDIPNTVAKAVESAVKLDVQMLTVHACGGAAMLRAAEQSAQDVARALGRPAPLVLGVTVLTSLDTSDLTSIGVVADVASQVERLAKLVVASGLRGLVCSPLEIVMLRKCLPAEVQLVTPGIRPASAKSDDQKRTLSPADALAAGANWLVIGRPITGAADPCAAAQGILESIRIGDR